MFDNTYGPRLALVAGLMISCAYLPAIAESEIESILVTGLRTPIPADEMATAVTVIDRETLEARQNFQLVDVLRDVPGLSVARMARWGLKHSFVCVAQRPIMSWC